MTTAPSSLTRLRQTYDAARAYVDTAGSSAAMEGHVSEFWAEILTERPNYPAFNEMLLMRRGFTYPMAERRDVGDEDAELEYASAAYIVATKSVPAAFLENLEEPAFGCPRPFDFAGQQLTANCLVNAITVYNLVEALRRAGIADRPLRILEIGAGFGAAARLLIERLDVSAYAVCDLPENLFLTAFYLGALFPDRAATFVDRTTTESESGLVFVVPPLIDQLEGPFDLVLNSYSFQEMGRASVHEYFSLAARVLAADGVFYSLNSHGKDEIVWPSDYPLAGFRIDSLRSPRKFPFQLSATIPYELVLRPSEQRDTVATGFISDGLDGIGCAFQLGLDEELDGLCDRFVASSLAAGEEAWLESLTALFRARTAAEKRLHVDALRDSGLFPSVCAYLAGCLAYATGESENAGRLLAEALPGLGSSLARLHSVAMIGTLATDDATYLETQRIAEELAPQLAGGVARVGRNQMFYESHMRKCLRLEVAPVPVPSNLRRAVRRIGRSIPTPPAR